MGTRRARVRAQLLSDTRPSAFAGTVGQVVSAVVGIQAQDLPSAALSIRARLPATTRADVWSAPLVLTWTLRGTRHLHHRHDAVWLVGLLGPAFNRPGGARARQLGIAGRVGDTAVEVLREAVADGGSLTRREVKDRLAAHGVDPSGQAAIHLVRRAALEGVLAIVPGTEERYVALAGRAGGAGAALDPAAAAAALARRYLSAFGPATASDFAAWSGLGADAVRQAWSAVGQAWGEVADPPVAPDVATDVVPDRSVGVRLLPAFDTFLLGYRDRRLHLAAEHRRMVNAGGGMVRPTLLIDGRVEGTWSHQRDVVEVSPFRPLTASEAAAVDLEVEAVGRFLRPDPIPRT